MKTLWLTLLGVSFLISPSSAGDTPLGAPLALTKTMPVSEVLSQPDQFVGKAIQVKGLVVDVCSRRGCWMALASDKGYDQLRVKVRDGVIVFPMEARGKEATVEGTVEKLVYSREQMLRWAKHHAEEKGEPFDPSTITEGKTFYQIRATGALLHDQ